MFGEGTVALLQIHAPQGLNAYIFLDLRVCVCWQRLITLNTGTFH